MAQGNYLAAHYTNMTLNWQMVLLNWDKITEKVYSSRCVKVKEFIVDNPCIMYLFNRTTVDRTTGTNVERTDGEQSEYVYKKLKHDIGTVETLILLERLLIPACRDIFDMAIFDGATYLPTLKEYLPYVPYNPRRPYVHCNPI
jgi:hypothetical protein